MTALPLAEEARNPKLCYADAELAGHFGRWTTTAGSAFASPSGMSADAAQPSVITITVKPEELLAESVKLTLQPLLVGDEVSKAQRRIENSLELCGKEVRPYLTETDRPGLFVPVMHAREGGEHPGFVLALEDRIILAWMKGMIRLKNFEAVVPYGSITKIETATDPRCMLSIQADEEWKLILYGVGDADATLLATLKDWIAARSEDTSSDHGSTSATMNPS